MTIALNTLISVAAGAGTSVATAAYNQPSGKHISVGVGWEAGSLMTCTGVTDTAGNTYVARTAENATFQAVQEWVALSPCLGDASNVITAAFSGATDFAGIGGAYFDTASATSFVAEPTGASGTSASPALSAWTAGALGIAYAKNFSGTSLSAAGTGWTILFDAPSAALSAIYRVDNPGGTYSAAPTLAASAQWVIAGASYDESGGGGGPAPSSGAAVLAGLASILGLGITPATA